MVVRERGASSVSYDNDCCELGNAIIKKRPPTFNL